MDKKPFTLTPARRAALELVRQGKVNFARDTRDYWDMDSGRLPGAQARTLRELHGAGLIYMILENNAANLRRVALTAPGEHLLAEAAEQNGVQA